MGTAETSGKIIPLNELVERVERLHLEGKTVVQSHGVFDIIHPGIVQHLQAAKEQGDVLVVTIIRDRAVRRGPGRPIFPESLRAGNVAALGMVDLVTLVDDSPPYQCVREIKPDLFAKGQTYMDRDREIHRKIFEEERELYFGATRLLETQGISFSASSIINNFLDIYPEETKSFLGRFKEGHSFDEIRRMIDEARRLKVLLVGDGIVDEYHYCASMGVSAKSPLVVNRYLSHEVFAGGAFAIANHLAGICDEVHLVSLLGGADSREEFVRATLKPNVRPTFYSRPDGPTVIKKRYLNQYLNQKLFEINFLNDQYIGGELEERIAAELAALVPGYDLVLVSDFGHGFITRRIIDTIQGVARKLAVNTQTNGANSGYNMITKYRKPYLVCLDETELRLAAQDKFADIETVARRMYAKVGVENLIVTLGKRGSLALSRTEAVRTPIFSSKVVDTVGAGDAYFSFTAPCLAMGHPLDLVGFIGNAVGALAVQIVGNRKPVEKHELLEFIHGLLK
jgi:rfaE bifunctional protein kinase chain/domain